MTKHRREGKKVILLQQNKKRRDPGEKYHVRSTKKRKHSMRVKKRGMKVHVDKSIGTILHIVEVLDDYY
jgi:hypothetical protein